ncbi:MAG: CotH kinase family protein [Planctomycetes bacterium]|nr:CotH kinase family protein [Planctomycetota bacterium]
MKRRTGATWLVALGAFALGGLVTHSLAEPRPSRDLPPLPSAAPQPGPLPELPHYELSLTAADLDRLTARRTAALAAGILEQQAADLVPVVVRCGAESARGRVRLKGDWTDHLDTDQWSLRFELDAPIRGMRRFAVQHPKTRGHTMEWVVMAVARRRGVLAPRADFATVAINGTQKGVYYLEEHPAKELLESQGRRDGPIVRFDESARWGTTLQYGFHRTGTPAEGLLRTQALVDAEVAGFDERRLLATPGLDSRLLRAIAMARDVQRLAVAGDPEVSVVRQLLALRRLEGRAVEDLFAAERLGKWLALYTLFRAFHGVSWIQWRLYHDPVLDRLEPIVFDTAADLTVHRGELVLDSPAIRWLTSSDAVLVAAWRELGQLTAPEFVDALLAELLPQVRAFDRAMQAAGSGMPGVDLAAALESLLRAQAAELQQVARPRHAAGFLAALVGLRSADGRDERAAEVESWSRTTIATELVGFRFRNGRIVPAAEALVGLAALPEAEDAVTVLPGGAVLLPADGARVRFRIPIDRRLADLGEVAALKRAIRQNADPERGAGIDLEVLYRPVAEPELRHEPLVLRRAPMPEVASLGRPPAPTLAQALERYPFLHYDLRERQLWVPEGRHRVDGDFLLPVGVPLHLAPGAELHLAPAAVVVVGALQAAGTAERPVRVGAQDPAQGFAGMVVLGSAGPSRLQHFELRHAGEIRRGGWHSSGGLTCLDAPVHASDCQFLAGRGEDVVNVFGCRVQFERCTFAGGPSDLLDGDFVTGTIVDCEFADAGEDAIDVSGSTVQVRGCRFRNIGDKALSVGEASSLTADACHIEAAAIAVAAKDRAEALLTGCQVDAVEHFLAAVYVKKPEFGPARLRLRGCRVPAAAPRLVQTGCELFVDDQVMPTQDVDVEALYRQRILGK